MINKAHTPVEIESKLLYELIRFSYTIDITKSIEPTLNRIFFCLYSIIENKNIDKSENSRIVKIFAPKNFVLIESLKTGVKSMSVKKLAMR